MRPYQLWYKQCGEWKLKVHSDNPSLVREAVRTLSLGKHTSIERVEIRDYTGVLETVYDRSWP